MRPIVTWRRPARSGPSTPLVVLLHGRGADEYDLLGIADRLPSRFAYASVRGFVPVDGGGFTWFENRGVGRPVPESVPASVAAFRAWLDDPALGCAATTCYLLGFSAGMMMAGALLLDDPARFAGGVLLSGALPPDETARTQGRLADKPIFYGHGSFDDVLPASFAAPGIAYLRDRSGARFTERAYPHAHAISNAELDDIRDWLLALA